MIDALDFQLDKIDEAARQEREKKLAVFHGLNDEAKEQGFKIPWSRRLPVIHEQFPSVRELDWYRLFMDEPDIYVRVISAILKADQAEPGRDGPRPSLDRERGEQSLRQMMGQDYSVLPFDESFAALARGLSLTQIARKTSIPRSIVHRLMRGAEEPTADEMASIAKAFGKHPSFFVEYRAAYITAFVHGRMSGAPETSIALYRKLSRQ